MDCNIVIGGEAGQGLKTINEILGKTLFRMNYNIFSTKDYMSRIRGGHNFISTRISTEEVNSPGEEIDILVAMNRETVDVHKEDLGENGIIIFEEKLDNDQKSIYLPASEIAAEINKKALNTVYIGAILKLLDLNLSICEEIISEYFNKDSIIEDNIDLLKKSYQKVDNDSIDLNKSEVNKTPDKKEQEIYLDGNKALALGALAAGVKYYTAYPMSPSTSIMSYIAGQQEKMEVIVEQAEDEIGAINMALGASYGGIRAMTATSGGGLSLMAEAMGLAGITETPLVVADVQRPGPATGLPTRTGQGDLLFAINISQDEFPLMVMAPRNHDDAFYQAFRAFNLAEKYQIPVIILSDQFLADAGTNMEKFDTENLEINRYLVSAEDRDENEEYKRYKLTEDGTSPRAYPGQLTGNTVLVDSDEHDQKGHITESAEVRNSMVDKRNSKLEKLKNEDLQEPDYFGDNDIDYLVVGWGSTWGPIKEACSLLKEEGIKIGFLSFSDVWPLPQEKLKKLYSPELETMVIEYNSTAQLAKLIAGEMNIEIDNKILKYDGRPFTGKEVYHRIKDEVIN